MVQYSRLYSLTGVVFIIILLSPHFTPSPHPNGFHTTINPNSPVNVSKQSIDSNLLPAAATFPFYDGFESGLLNDSWQVYTTKEGRVEVSDSWQAYAGSYSLLLDEVGIDTTFSYADAILTIDLEGQSQVELDFWWSEFGEYDSIYEGVYLSADDGVHWYEIMDFQDDPGGWRHQVIDLDAQVELAGISLNNHFQIRFRFNGGGAIPDEGIAIDEVQVRNKPIVVAANLPFYESFESGSLGDSWQAYFTNEGHLQVSASYPYSGTYSLLLDDFRSDDIYSYSDAILTLDLSEQSQAVLDFWWSEFGEDSTYEGVFISDDDGAHWYEIMDFSADPESWQNEIIDLDAKVAATGLAFNDHFQIRFRFHGDDTIPEDGYAIDEVQVYANKAPVLSWPGDSNYTEDGLHPESGDTYDAFTYRIRYLDWEGEAPEVVNLHLLKAGQEISNSPFTMTCGSGDYSAGVICSYTVTGLATGTDYAYYFSAQDSSQNPAKSTEIITAPTVHANSSPNLSWPGDDNYNQDGLHPEMGFPGDIYTYRVKYSDPDEDRPGYTRIHILRSGQEIAGSPFELTCPTWNYLTGVICSYTKVGLAASNDYAYFFSAQDEHSSAADSTVTIDGPLVHPAIYLPVIVNVAAPPSAPVLNEISNPTGSYKFTVSWNPVARADRYVIEQDTESTFPNPEGHNIWTGFSYSVIVDGPGTYYYRVKAVNSFGDSPWSNIVATQVTQTPTGPMVGTWTGNTTWGPIRFLVTGTSPRYVSNVVLEFDLCEPNEPIELNKEYLITDNHFYAGDSNRYVTGNFTSVTKANGEFYAGEWCYNFEPPLYIIKEGVWFASFLR